MVAPGMVEKGGWSSAFLVEMIMHPSKIKSRDLQLQKGWGAEGGSWCIIHGTFLFNRCLILLRVLTARSWGQGGHPSVASHLRAIQNFPPNLRVVVDCGWKPKNAHRKRWSPEMNP